MRMLVPDPATLDLADLGSVYPWPDDGTWVRSMMVTSLDGAATGPDGLSGPISGAADHAVFHAVRRFADVVLVGAGTIRAEGYGPVRPDDDGRAARLAIVSASLDLPWESRLFADGATAPLVYTGPSGDPGARALAQRHCELVTLPGARIDAGALVEDLVDRGLRRIVCEGGPTLLAAVVEADVLDEADLTIAPVLAGTEMTPRVPRLDPLHRFVLRQLLEDDGYLMARYVRRA